MTAEAEQLRTDVLDYTGERMVPERAQDDIFWEHIYRYRFATRFVRNRHVLDIACGEGYGTAALKQAGAAGIVGMDINHTTVQHAARKYGIDARIGNAEGIDLASHSLQVIVSFETIEHLMQPERFLEECKRLLQQGGALIVSTPDRTASEEWKAATHIQEGNPFHCSEFDQEEFSGLLGKYFSRVALYGQCPTWASMGCLYSLSSQETTWLKLRGVYRLRGYFRRLSCSHLWKPITPHLRDQAIHLIVRDENPLAYLVNPYLVRRLHRLGRVRSKYLVAVARA